MRSTLIVLAALPLIRGDAIDTQLSTSRSRPPGGGRARASTSTLPANTRAIVLPGQDFAYYNWGGTLDAILPRLTSKPVAVRYETPYADLHSVDMLDTIDDLVQQQRLLPGELQPLLYADRGRRRDHRRRRRHRALRTRSTRRRPRACSRRRSVHAVGRATGRSGSTRPRRATSGRPCRCPRCAATTPRPARDLVHIDPVADPTIVDGGAETLADMAAFGKLPSTASIFYAGDQSRAQTFGRWRRRAPDLVIRLQSPPRIPAAVHAAEPRSGAAATTPLADRRGRRQSVSEGGTDAQTVAVLEGARVDLQTPTQAGDLQFPEPRRSRPSMDRSQTAWVADRLSARVATAGFRSRSTSRATCPTSMSTRSMTHTAIVTEVDVNGIELRRRSRLDDDPRQPHHVLPSA